MNKEEVISNKISPDRSRRGVLSKDKYHWVVRLYRVNNRTDSLYATRLVYEESKEFAEDIIERFINKTGEFETLESPVRGEPYYE